MPVVITDRTNKVWAVEQPNDGLIHVGYTGEPGPTLLDILDFVKTRGKQFSKFVENRREAEEKANAKQRRAVANPLRQNPEL
jgi:hypothetical protein